MKALKAFFLSRLSREKILVASLLVAGALIWAVSFGKRASVFWKLERKNHTTLAAQEVILKKRAEVDAAAQKAVSKLVPSNTLNDTRLNALLNTLATGANLRPPNITQGKPTTTPQFSIYTMDVRLQNADWRSFLSFYQELEKKSPYVSIEEMSITPVTSGGGGNGNGGRGGPAAAAALAANAVTTHTVTMKVSSVEIRQN